MRAPRSLFWTFAGGFLLALLVAAVLQVVLVAAVVRPLLRAAQVDEARRATTAAADSLAALDADADGRTAMRALFSARSDGDFVLVWMDREEQVGFPPFSPRNVVPLEEFLERGWPSSRGGRRGPGRGGPPGAPEDAGRGGSLPERGGLRELARAPIGPDAARGYVIAVFREPRFSLLPPGTPRPLLLFLPVAFVVAGGAGLLLFRGVVRRLRRLEVQTEEVAEGNLAARIPDPGRDEIGRLAEALNRMTAALAAARDRVAESDRQRSRLLGDVTHELATPLTSIRGYAETLTDAGITLTEEERRAYVGHILDESERLDAMIRDLLDLSRLESGAAGLHPERLDWAALVRHTVDRFRTAFRTAGLTLVDRDLRDPAWVTADGRALERVVENLLVNALRHVPAGETVTVALVAADGEQVLVVEDTGPGVPEEDLPRVFDRFTRSDPSRSAPGSGLGLAIVRGLVEAHGGRIGAANRTPHGLAVTVALPAEPPTA